MDTADRYFEEALAHHREGRGSEALGLYAQAIDALRVGVPVIALAGEAHSARTGASILAAIGLDEAITDSLDAYEQLVYALATDKAALAALTAKLARNRDSAPLFDPSRLARHLELAYRMMWERHAASRGPETICVPHLPA